MNKIPFLFLFLVICYSNVLSQIISHSNSQEIVDGSEIACNDAGVINNNEFYRSFVLNDFDITTPWSVSSVEIGIQELNSPDGSFPITVSLYTTDGPFPTGNLTELASLTQDVPNQELAIYQFPIFTLVPANSELVVKVSVFSDGVTHFFPGHNLEGQTAPWWLASAECGIPDPTDVVDLGLNEAWVLNVVGTPEQGAISFPSECGLGINITDNACPVNDEYEILVENVPGIFLGDVYSLSDVNLIIQHTFDSDLQVRLTSPDGNIVDLVISRGGAGDNMGDPNDPTCTAFMNLNMDANTPVGNGNTPFIGSFIPDGDFADFNGGNANGTWIFGVCDNAGIDVGTIEYVELIFSTPEITCQSPSNLTAENITPVSADLGWFEIGSAEQWKVEVVLSGVTPTGTGIVTNENPYMATGLDQSTVYDFYVKSICAPGDESSWSGPFTFTTAVDAIGELSFDKNVSVFPNPASNYLTIRINAEITSGSLISLLNLQGQIVYEKTIGKSISDFQTTIDITGYTKGVYMLKIENEYSSIFKRVIFQ